MADPTPAVRTWLDKWSIEQREQVERLLSRVGDVAPEATADVKWGRPTVSLGGDWHHWMCAVAVSKREVALVFHKGALLDDPAGLLQGTGRYIRRVPYETVVAHADAVDALVHEAVAHRTDMLDGAG